MGTHIQRDNTSTSGFGFVVDEDNMASDSATKVPTQQSSKAYVDNAPRQKLVTRESGLWYGAVGNSAASTGHNVSAAQVLMTMPVWLAAGTYDRIAVTTSVAAVSTWRLGVYNCDQTTGDPRGQSLVIDCGTVDMNATPGLLAITTSITIPTTGLYGLTVLCDAFTALPTVYRHDNSSTNLQVIPNVSVNTVETAGRSARFTVRHTGVSTGSLPATHPTGGAWTDAGPRILLRKT